MAQSYEEWLKKYQDAYAAKQNEEIAASDAIFNTQKAQVSENYDKQKAQVTDTYNNQITDTKDSYTRQYDENAVQKLVNERQIAENMANLGLTDSGLNRTQQTAVQLSYANNRQKIDTEKQKAIDKLSASLASAVSSIDMDKANAVSTIDVNRSTASSNIASSYNQLAAKNAQSSVEAEIQAETERQKAAIAAETARQEAAQKAAYIIQTNGGTLSRNFMGTLQDNNVSVIQNGNGTTTYVDNNSGKKTTLNSAVNPFTGTTNKDTEYGVFSNGYQPNNIKNNKLKKVNGVTIKRYGNEQSVWEKDGTYYFWEGESNSYKELTDKEKQMSGLL